MKTIGLVIKSLKDKNTEKPLLAVYIPTTPNPTSGFYILVSREETIPLNISIEDAFKLIMSAGMSISANQIELREENGPEGKGSPLNPKAG